MVLLRTKNRLQSYSDEKELYQRKPIVAISVFLLVIYFLMTNILMHDFNTPNIIMNTHTYCIYKYILDFDLRFGVFLSFIDRKLIYKLPLFLFRTITVEFLGFYHLLFFSLQNMVFVRNMVVVL